MIWYSYHIVLSRDLSKHIYYPDVTILFYASEFWVDDVYIQLCSLFTRMCVRIEPYIPST